MEKKPDETPVVPQSLITETHVKAALEADKGTDVHLISWEVKDFTKKGDNYACIVTSVQVKYSQHGTDSNVSYVVKLNPCRNMETFEAIVHWIFSKEIKFYTTVLPDVNTVLKSIGLEPLRMALCYFGNLDERKELLFLEDLRPKGFRMFDRRKGMDKAHVTLVLNELARLHAASLVLQKQNPDEDFDEKYDFLFKDWMNYNEEAKKNAAPILGHHITSGIGMLQKVRGYEKSISWLEDLKPRLLEIFEYQLGRSKYEVICHGDCWNNNVLFRYNDDGIPIEVMLVDLQVCRRASFATDLNYLLYTSLTGEVRKPNLEGLLADYHDSFNTVMNAGGMDMPFTKDELHHEFQDKNMFGVLSALMILPIVLMESDDVPNMDNLGEEDLNKLMEEFREQSMKMLDKNPLMKPRFLSIFDEMIERGLIV